MSKNCLNVIGFLIIFGLFCCNMAAAQGDAIGSVEVDEGQVLIIRDSGNQEVGEGDSVPIFVKDTLQTAGDSFGIVAVGEGDDADEFALDENTTFVVANYVGEEDGAKRGVFSLLGGKVRAVVNNVQGDKDYKIQTSSATVGVKGTDFITEVPNPEVTQVTTLQGVVALQTRIGDVLKEVEVGAGFSSMALSGSEPTSPFALSRESLLEAALDVPRSTAAAPVAFNARDIARDETTVSFQKARFDEIVEKAARVKGSLIRVQIQFR